MFSRRTDWEFHDDPLAAAAARRRAAGELFDLTETNPTRCGFDFSCEAIPAALAQSGIFRYDPDPQGLLTARAAVAQYYAARNAAGAEARPLSPAGSPHPERIWLTAGSSESYSHWLRLLCDAGDRVHVPRPGYPLLDLLAGLQDVELAPYPLDPAADWKIDLDALAASLSPRSRAILLIHPNNPTGSYLEREEWSALQALAARRELAVIVDEVFYDYALEFDAPAGRAEPAGFSEPAALTCILNGVSKISALPQMKLGWFILRGPQALAEAAARRLEPMLDSYLTVDTPVQLAAAELLAARRTMQPRILARLRANLAALDRQIQACPGLSRWKIGGGWQAILRLPGIFNDEEWARRLLAETGVYAHPGHFYGLDHLHDASGAGRNAACLVLSLLPESETFARAIEAGFRYIGAAMH